MTVSFREIVREGMDLTLVSEESSTSHTSDSRDGDHTADERELLDASFLALDENIRGAFDTGLCTWLVSCSNQKSNVRRTSTDSWCVAARPTSGAATCITASTPSISIR